MTGESELAPEAWAAAVDPLPPPNVANPNTTAEALRIARTRRRNDECPRPYPPAVTDVTEPPRSFWTRPTALTAKLMTPPWPDPLNSVNP